MVHQFAGHRDVRRALGQQFTGRAVLLASGLLVSSLAAQPKTPTKMRTLRCRRTLAAT